MKLLKAVIVALAAVALYAGVVRVRAEYVAYRTTQAQTAAVFQFLADSVGTRTGEDGKPAPVSRADVLASLAAQAVAQAAKAQAPAAVPAPPVK